MIGDGHKGRGQGRPCYKMVVRGELSERCVPECKGMNWRAKDGRTALVEELVSAWRQIYPPKRKGCLNDLRTNTQDIAFL